MNDSHRTLKFLMFLFVAAFSVDGMAGTAPPPEMIEFTVFKIFSDGNPATVQVTLTCIEADVDQNTKPASQGNPAVFILTAIDAPECTATELVPAGYSETSNTCISVDPLDFSSCTITNSFDAVMVEIQQQSNAAEPNQDGAFQLVLSGSPPFGGMDVNFTVGGTAGSGSDYASLGASVFVPFGVTSQALPVAVIDDGEIEGTETVIVTLQAGTPSTACDGPCYLVGSPAQATVTILDDDRQYLTLSATSSTSEPSGTGTFTLTLAEPAETSISVDFTLSGTAIPDEDFIRPQSPLIIPSGSMTATISIVVKDDQVDEGAETVTVTISPPEGIPIEGNPSATITIQDDDFAGIEVNPTSGLMTSEDGTQAEFTVVLATQPIAPVTIPVKSSDTTEGTVSPETLEFTPDNWSMPKTVTITGADDAEEDGDVAYTIILGPVVSDDENYASIDPDDVSVTNANVPFGEAEFTLQVYSVNESDGTARIDIRRIGNTFRSLTVTFETVDDSENTTATAGEDYSSTSAEIFWAEGETADKFVDIQVFENIDKNVGETETVELKLSGDHMDDNVASLEIKTDFVQDIVDFLDDLDLPPNQREMARVIGEACTQGVIKENNEADFQALCGALVFSGLGGQALGPALKETTPDNAAAVRSSGMQTTNVQISAVDGRLGTLRGGGGAGFSASGFSMNYGDVAFSGGLIKSFLSAFDQNKPAFMQNNAGQNDDSGVLDEFGRWGAWISGRLVFGEKDPTTNQIEYDFDTAGLTFGLDYRFTEEFVAGLAVGYSNTDADLGNNDGELDTDGYSVSLYGTYFKSDLFYLGGSIAYGSNDYDQKRNVRYTLDVAPCDGVDPACDVNQILAAEYDGTQFSMVLNGGWDFQRDGWTFGPTFRVSYVDVDVDDYSETLLNPTQQNATFGWAVHIDDQNYESLQASIGFEISNAISRDWGVFIPQGYIDLVSELKDDGSLVTGQFLGDGNNVQFTLMTDDFEETFARAGLGFGLVLKNNKSAFLMFDSDLGRDLLKTYYINAGFRWQF